MGAQPQEEAEARVLMFEPPRVTPRRKWLLGAAAIAVAIAVAAAVWMSKASAPKAVAPLASRTSIPLVSVVTPGVQPVSTQVTFTGTIEARHQLPIGNSGDTGRIVAVYVQVGDRVRRGQLLARIDDSVLAPQVAQLSAALDQARAQAALSAAEYRRGVAVGPDGGLSAQDIEKLQATSVMDAANIKVVTAQLAVMRAKLALTRIVAPVDGIVLTRNAEVGQIASSGGPALFDLEDAGQVEMIGQVAEQDMADLKVGQSASVYLIGNSKPFVGRIWLLGAVIDPQSRMGEVRIALRPDPALRPGAFAHSSVTLDRAKRPVLPQTAVMADGSGSYVYVVGRDDQVQRRAVEVGSVLPGGVVILQGLSGREHVIAMDGGFLHSGERVSVASAGTPQS
ncbi:MAG TPA: efflux RND transporter periplasmic adaptor subunit [Steroidobacteraceae bacterium]|jgi:RND family efflux transporter MFP subunit|nr:efflux RND transporter periplasmic adaptor subunit [Steroidobacteraceae bacterium]